MFCKKWFFFVEKWFFCKKIISTFLLIECRRALKWSYQLNTSKFLQKQNFQKYDVPNLFSKIIERIKSIDRVWGFGKNIMLCKSMISTKCHKKINQINNYFKMSQNIALSKIATSHFWIWTIDIVTPSGIQTWASKCLLEFDTCSKLLSHPGRLSSDVI